LAATDFFRAAGAALASQTLPHPWRRSDAGSAEPGHRQYAGISSDSGTSGEEVPDPVTRFQPRNPSLEQVGAW